MAYRHFEFIEKHVWSIGILIAIMVSLGGLAEITPLFMEANKVQPAQGVKPYAPLRLAGRDIYVREGCYLCHSQMIRALRFETQRYGHYSVASESVYDRPFQWGSKRTGPDLSRVGGKYSDEWQRVHLSAPRSVVPESNMPDYAWLSLKLVDGADLAKRMRVLRMLGDPYTDEDIRGAAKAVAGKTEMDALVAYLQGLGIDNEPVAASAAGHTQGTAASDAAPAGSTQPGTASTPDASATSSDPARTAPSPAAGAPAAPGAAPAPAPDTRTSPDAAPDAGQPPAAGAASGDGR